MTEDKPRFEEPSEPLSKKRSVTQTISKSRPIKREEALIVLGSSKLSDYTKISMLGKGTYGEVHKCVHKPTGLIVAMKTYMFENVTNGINYSTMREISLLRQLVNYP